MSTAIETQSNEVMSAAFPASQEEGLSDDEVSGSSSLSDIADQEGLEPATSDIENTFEGNDSDENETEAETERLEDSPHSARKHKHVVLRSYGESKTYDRSPSKLQDQLLAHAEDEDDDETRTGDEDSGNESTKSGSDEEAATSHVPSVEEQKAYTTPDSKKRKRHTIMDGGVAEKNDRSEEPANKRVCSMINDGNAYLDEEEDVLVEDDVEMSNPTNGEDGADDQDDNEDLQPISADKGPLEILAEASSKKAEKRNTRQSQDSTQNGLDSKAQDAASTADKLNGNRDPPCVGDEAEGLADVEEYDEAEIALRNVEEVEKKRTAIDQLSAIEKHVRIFRIRLCEERIAQLELEEAQLRQESPTHPEYLSMVRCIDELRDDRIGKANRRREYALQTAQNFAVSRRSQILGQYAQTARDIREAKLEALGKQWYEIQSDRRCCSGGIPDYAYKFSEKRSQKITNQMSYNKEVSILSGVAKYVGFPAAPSMAPATAAQIEEDFERMGIRTHHQQARQGRPVRPEFAAFRAASSRYKLVEDQQFIEQHAWANAAHPMHQIHRQGSSQQGLVQPYRGEWYKR